MNELVVFVSSRKESSWIRIRPVQCALVVTIAIIIASFQLQLYRLYSLPWMYLKILGKHFIIRRRSAGAGQVPPLSTSPWVEISVRLSYTNFSAILVFLRSTSGYSEIHFNFEMHSESRWDTCEYRVGLLTGKINNKLEKSNLNEWACA